MPTDNTNPTREYFITWEINIEASGPVEAARQAREVQQRQDRTGSQVFEVIECSNDTKTERQRIDLDEIGPDADHFFCPGCGEAWALDDSDADDPETYCSADCERRDRAALRSRGEA